MDLRKHGARFASVIAALATVAAANAQTGHVYARDYPSIQAAIDACPVGQEWTVHLEPQTYNLGASIVLHSGITLLGVPGSILACSSPLIPAVTATGTAQTVTTTLPQPADPLELKVASTAAFQPGDMVYVFGGSEIDSHANEVTQVINSTTLGVRYRRLDTVVSGKPVQKVAPADAIVVKSVAINGSSNTFAFTFTRDTAIENIQAAGSALNPIFLGSLRPRVYDSVFTTMGGGLSFQSSTAVTCTNNTVSNYKLGGIFLRSCSDGSVRNNALASNHAYAFGGNSGDGITVAFSSAVRVVENTMTNSSCYGAWVLNSQNCLLQKNVVTNSFTSAYYVTDSLSCTVIDNLSQNLSTAHGVVIERGSGSLVQGNTSLNVQIGFVVLETSNLTFGKNYATTCALDQLFSGNTGMVVR